MFFRILQIFAAFSRIYAKGESMSLKYFAEQPEGALRRSRTGCAAWLSLQRQTQYKIENFTKL